MKNLTSLILLTLIINFGYGQKQNKINAEYFLFDKNGKKITSACSYIGSFSKKGYAVFTVGGNYVEAAYGKITNAKYGIIHESGKIIVPATFDYLEGIYNSDSMFISEMNGAYGLIKENGTTVIAPSYQEITSTYDLEGLILAKSTDGLYQILDLDGKPLSKKYQDIVSSTNGYIVQANGYKGFIDVNYAEVFPCIYQNITVISSTMFHIEDKYMKHFFMNAEGKIIGERYDYIDQAYDDTYQTIGYKVTKRGKQGLVDLTGDVLIPPTFNDLSMISMGCSNYIYSYKENDGKMGLLNSDGKKIGKACFSSINTTSYFGKYILVGIEKKTKGKKKKNSEDNYDWDGYSYTPTFYGLVDINGKWALPAVYEDYAWAYGDQSLVLLKKKDEWFALDEELKSPFKGHFTHIETMGDLFKVQMGGVDNGYGTPEGGVFGLFDKLGNQVLPTEFEDISQISYSNENGFIIKKGGKYGLCNSTGKIILQPEYSEMDCSNNPCIVSRYHEQSEKNKMGLLNRLTIKEIVPTQYDFIQLLQYDGDYLFQENNNFGLISSSGQIVLPAKYNYLSATDLYDKDDWVLANAYGEVTSGYYGKEVTGGNWGLINVNGDTLLPFKFKKISFENDSIANVLDYDNKAYLLNLNTNSIVSNEEANYISKLNYDWLNPLFLIGKNVTMGEYGDPTGGTYGIINLRGEVIIPMNYSEIKMEGTSFIANSLDFNGYDLLDNKGNIIVSKAMSIKTLNDSLFMITTNSKASLYNVNTNAYLLNDKYVDFSTPEYSYGYDQVFGIKNSEDQWGIINKQGDILITPQYCDVLLNGESYFIAGKCTSNGGAFSYGVVDLNNNVLIPFEYENIESQYGGNFNCIKGNEIFYINLNNEVISKRKTEDEGQN